MDHNLNCVGHSLEHFVLMLFLSKQRMQCHGSQCKIFRPQFIALCAYAVPLQTENAMPWITI